jgi:hypothetical protein
VAVGRAMDCVFRDVAEDVEEMESEVEMTPFLKGRRGDGGVVLGV